MAVEIFKLKNCIAMPRTESFWFLMLDFGLPELMSFGDVPHRNNPKRLVYSPHTYGPGVQRRPSSSSGQLAELALMSGWPARLDLKLLNYRLHCQPSQSVLPAVRGAAAGTYPQAYFRNGFPQGLPNVWNEHWAFVTE
eukprot:1543358-Pleurochrysis_carterae.AAC.4